MRIIRIRDIEFDFDSRLVLRSGKEVRPLENPVAFGRGWFVPCGFGFDDTAGDEYVDLISLGDDVTMIRGAHYDGEGDR